MELLTCPHCGQTYNPRYMQYCARCGEAVPDEHGKLPKPGPMDGMGARGGSNHAKATRAAVEEPEAHPEQWQPTQAVQDMVLEYRTRLNEAPEDHSVRYDLALAYLLAQQWKRAAEELRQVIEAMPDYADAHARLAIALANAGDRSDALQVARQALALEPDNARYASLAERLEALVNDGN